MPVFETVTLDVRKGHHSQCQSRMNVKIQVVDEYGNN